MKNKRNCIIGMLILCLLLTVVPDYEIKAALSYSDPKTFFDTCTDQKRHAEFTDGYIYYCTKGKTAGSSSYKRFRTIGFQITASAGDNNGV